MGDIATSFSTNLRAASHRPSSGDRAGMGSRAWNRCPVRCRRDITSPCRAAPRLDRHQRFRRATPSAAPGTVAAIPRAVRRSTAAELGSRRDARHLPVPYGGAEPLEGTPGPRGLGRPGRPGRRRGEYRRRTHDGRHGGAQLRRKDRPAADALGLGEAPIGAGGWSHRRFRRDEVGCLLLDRRTWWVGALRSGLRRVAPRRRGARYELRRSPCSG